MEWCDDRKKEVKDERWYSDQKKWQLTKHLIKKTKGNLLNSLGERERVATLILGLISKCVSNKNFIDTFYSEWLYYD